jgi:hypothetical protein
MNDERHTKVGDKCDDEAQTATRGEWLAERLGLLAAAGTAVESSMQ